MIKQNSQHLRIPSSQPYSKLRVKEGACVLPEYLLLRLVLFSLPVKAYGIIQSIGRVATCYDNAPMESLNGIIKTEALYSRFGKTRVKEKRVPIKDIVDEVIRFIEFYNNERPKKYLGWLSPVAFRQQNPKGVYLMVIQ